MKLQASAKRLPSAKVRNNPDQMSMVEFEDGSTNQDPDKYTQTNMWMRMGNVALECVRKGIRDKKAFVLLNDAYVFDTENLVQVRVTPGVVTHNYMRRVQITYHSGIHDRNDNIANCNIRTIVSKAVAFHTGLQTQTMNFEQIHTNLMKSWEELRKNNAQRFDLECQIINTEYQAICTAIVRLNYNEYSVAQYVHSSWRDDWCKEEPMPADGVTAARTGRRLSEESPLYAWLYDMLQLSLLIDSPGAPLNDIGRMSQASYPSTYSKVNYRPTQFQGKMLFFANPTGLLEKHYLEKRHCKETLFENGRDFAQFEAEKATCEEKLQTTDMKEIKQVMQMMEQARKGVYKKTKAQRLYAEWLSRVHRQYDELCTRTVNRLNEQLVFHGTRTQKSVGQLLTHGQVTECNDVFVHGRGTYFAKYLAYSLKEQYSTIHTVSFEGEDYYAKSVVLARCVRGSSRVILSSDLNMSPFSNEGIAYDSGISPDGAIVISWSTTITHIDGVMYLLWPVSSANQ